MHVHPGLSDRPFCGLLAKSRALQQLRSQQAASDSSCRDSKGRPGTGTTHRSQKPDRTLCRDAAQHSVSAEPAFLDSIKFDAAGLVPVIAQPDQEVTAEGLRQKLMQDVDTGEILMQAFSDRAGIEETLQTRLATFYSRSRKGRWCKGETSGNFIRVQGVFLDCDRDSVIYTGEPDGPTCHTGAHTCYFKQGEYQSDGITQYADQQGRKFSPVSSLLALESTIRQRKAESDANNGASRSWTAKLLHDDELLCKKIREEAGELCETLEKNEGKERAVSEMADLLYHAMVLLNKQGVSMREVGRELRSRFGTSGIDEKASRPAKAA